MQNYTRMLEAEGICKRLVETYPDIFPDVDPNSIVAMGLQVKRPKHYLANIRIPRGIIKALFEMLKTKYEFVIEIPLISWAPLDKARKQWILFHELCHIYKDPETGKYSLLQHDVQDFALVLKNVDIGWQRSEKLPELLGAEPFKF